MSAKHSGSQQSAKHPPKESSGAIGGASSEGPATSAGAASPPGLPGGQFQSSSFGNAVFQTLHVAQAQSQLLDLYQRVACEKGRIEIHNDGGVCDCVLISKDELDSIERALDMLSSQDHVQAMRDALAKFTRSVMPPGALATNV